MSTRSARRVRRITVRVACAQLGARPIDHAKAALRDVVAAIRAASARGADLVVLPECSYPGYVLLGAYPYRRPIPSDDEALEVVAREAVRSRVDVCIGIARRGSSGALRNAAVYIDADGRELGTYTKCRLWNFDHRWFARGRALPVVTTRFGPIGMMICADGRNPEIARTLVASGARLILDPTAWVGSAPSHDALRNPQADYMLRVRALENGVWIAAADKCGSELGAVHYAGRSQIVAPDGSLAAIADATTQDIITADLRPRPARMFVAALSAADMATLRAAPRRPRVPARVPKRLWLGIYQSLRGRRDDHHALAALLAQGASAIISTGAKAGVVRHILRRAGVSAAVLEGDELLAPEPARAAALRGVDLIAWLRPPTRPLVLETARTRALENRTYVALCTYASQPTPACLVAPDGNVSGSALARVPSGFVAAIDPILARRKEVVPSTQTFADRMPHLYRYPSAGRSGSRT